MGEMKPLGSEKLSSNDKLKRILELTYFESPINEHNTSNKKYELIVESPSGLYAIEKEKDGYYYVKKGVNESSLDYIGGMFMKNKNRSNDYANAFKRLDYLKGQEMLNEATKYVLKGKPAPQPSPQPEMEAPSPEQSIPTPSPDVLPDATSPELPTDTQTDDTTDSDFSTDVEGDTLKSIQKLSGKLGQKLREFDPEIKSNDIKYVLNMVISAIDLDKLDDTDKDEILGKLEGNEEDENGFQPDNGEQIPSPENNDIEQPEDELGEVSDKLEEFTNTDFDFDDEDEPIDGYNTENNYEDTSLENYEENPVSKYESGNKFDTENDLEETEFPEENSDLRDFINSLNQENDTNEEADIDEYFDTTEDEDFTGGLEDDLLSFDIEDNQEKPKYRDELSLNEIKNIIKKNLKK